MELDARWIVGFVDGEGCFHIGLNSHPEMTAGFQVLPEFTVVQHERDVLVLEALKNYFGCGVVRVNNGDRMAYRVRGHENLSKCIVPFFDKYPLRSRKRLDFLMFKDVVSMMSRREHLSVEGVERIRSIAGKMNRKGLVQMPDWLDTHPLASEAVSQTTLQHWAADADNQANNRGAVSPL